ncbi:MAG: glycerol-3-phosphate acyltransferase, partial [Chloroflexi bacterium]|nr:glycerol-3-phosphate acyltransferase [Chloroflexota bacterium]
GNVGAANAFRQLGKKIGIGVFLVDAAKGALAILIAREVAIPQLAILASGAAAVIGHTWPAFIGFRGGRGLATTLGVLAAVIPRPILILAAPALVALLARRSTGIAGGVIFIPLPLVCWWLELPAVLVVYSIALPFLLGIISFLRSRPTATGQA